MTYGAFASFFSPLTLQVPLAVAFPAGSLLAEIAHGPKDAPMTRQQLPKEVSESQTQAAGPLLALPRMSTPVPAACRSESLLGA